MQRGEFAREMKSGGVEPERDEAQVQSAQVRHVVGEDLQTRAVDEALEVAHMAGQR